MRITKAARIASTVTLAALIALGAAACGKNAQIDGGGKNTSAEQPAVKADPKAAIAVAAEKVKQESYSFSMTMAPEVEMTAQVDPVAKAAHATMKVTAEGFSMNTEMIMLGDDMYMKMTGGFMASDKWMHFDSTDADLGKAWDQKQMDPAEFLKQVGDVEQIDAHTYKGTLDLSKMDLSSMGSEQEKAAKDAAGKMGAVPFTLVLDDQGRIAKLEMTMKGIMPDGSDRTMVMTVTDYGTPVSVQAPPKDQVQEGFGF
ncbi:hypothetical protein Afil01_56820 [Actinorhabdospora filicis]|uniref:Lipoprotein n=1 Tax=Actinorhabdospora filicis TaxID=1785913 RepID=A0A9W6SQ21_9ACTN|nr:hypothetical protein [Actinorhabdospora filicis]GLZ80875.1 hypothetical protein Afil01_56820 [Actinorhabdospora filicis]